ncbi:MAG: beta-ketoacyl synthase N-terminal-like domain-containing protein, partial [Planctomycetota bacterium]
MISPRLQPMSQAAERPIDEKSPADRRQRRVVVTGLGCVTPLGSELDQVWRRLVEGRSGVGRITLFDAANFPVRVAAEVPNWDAARLGDVPERWRHQPRQTSFAVAAAQQAVASAGLEEGRVDPRRFGVYLGCGEAYPDFGPFGDLIAAALQSGHFEADVFLRESLENGHHGAQLEWEPNLPAAHLAGLFGAEGPNANCTSACVSSAHAV